MGDFSWVLEQVTIETLIVGGVIGLAFGSLLYVLGRSVVMAGLGFLLGYLAYKSNIDVLPTLEEARDWILKRD